AEKTTRARRPFQGRPVLAPAHQLLPRIQVELLADESPEGTRLEFRQTDAVLSCAQADARAGRELDRRQAVRRQRGRIALPFQGELDLFVRRDDHTACEQAVR